MSEFIRFAPIIGGWAAFFQFSIILTALIIKTINLLIVDVKSKHDHKKLHKEVRKMLDESKHVDQEVGETS